MQGQKKGININDNAFDLIRIAAALVVMTSHLFRHFGVAKPVWLFFFTDGSVGVICFFAMTGFLSMYSYEKSISKCNFIKWIKRRIIRIYPILLLSFVVILIIDGTLLGEKMSAVEVMKYFVKYVIMARGGGQIW